MKHFLFTLGLALSCLMASAQYFEGEVTYHNSYKSKVPAKTDEQLAVMLGNVQHWYIKGGSYKSAINGSYTQWQLYVNPENRIYTKVANAEGAFYNDASVDTDPISNVEVHKDAAEVLGYKCDELVLTNKSGIQKYYYSSKLGIDPKLFANHKFGNWYAYVEKAHAVPLKMIVEMPQLTMESVAVDIKPQKLNNSFFKIPAGMKTSKSPY